MSITTTPLLDLIKPDRQEPVRSWPWQNLRNSIILDNKVKTQFLSYTPELTASTTNPVLGTGGLITANYIRLANRLIILYGRFKFGTSGINIGNGSYLFSLPIQADTGLHNISSQRAFDIVGRWAYRDNNVTANRHTGSVEISDSIPNAAVAFNYGYQAGDFVGSADPFIPQAGDALSFYCMYQEAL